MRPWLTSALFATCASAAFSSSQPANLEELGRFFNWACHLENYAFSEENGQFSLDYQWRVRQLSFAQFADSAEAEGFDLEALKFTKSSTPMNFGGGEPPVVTCELSFAVSLSADELSSLGQELATEAAKKYEPAEKKSHAPEQFGAFKLTQNANVVLSGSSSDDALTLRATAMVSK